MQNNIGGKDSEIHYQGLGIYACLACRINSLCLGVVCCCQNNLVLRRAEMTTILSVLIIIGVFVSLDFLLYFAEVFQGRQDYKNGVRSCGRWILH